MSGYTPILPLSLSSTDGAFTLHKNIRNVIRQNFKNLLFTSPGERIMDSNFGIGIKNFLFEQKISETYYDIKEKIKEQTSIYMPYMKIVKIDVFDSLVNNNLRENEIILDIQYIVPSLSITDSLREEIRF